MEPELNLPPTPAEAQTEAAQELNPEAPLPLIAAPAAPEPPETRFLKMVFLGPNGLRAGWSIGIWLILVILIAAVPIGIISLLHHSSEKRPEMATLTPISTIVNDGVQAFAILGATLIMALIERRRITAYFLNGRRGFRNFAWGLLAGFGTLSLLIGFLYLGHFITFGPVALSGIAIWQNAALWGIGFLLVGLTEEGMMRCYLLFSLNRGFSFTAWSFWIAATISSILFALIHMGNPGESAFGIFCVFAIGMVFCASVRWTGSLWWAIGYHAAWDWAQTYFYGTADSGLIAKGHYLTTAPAGNPLWSGGSVGPEGSYLIAPVIAITALGLWLAWGREAPYEPVQELIPVTEPAHAPLD